MVTIYERRHNFTEPLNMWENRLALYVDIANLTDTEQPLTLDRRAGRITASIIIRRGFLNAVVEELTLGPCTFENFEEYDLKNGRQ